MLTIAQVAALLNIHPNTVRVWSNKGLLRAYRLGFRRDRRFRLQDVDAFLGEGAGKR
ncbi:MAG: helix-turn-helix domain-containing protein [Chloroflexi bacterium]|nr:helix-turn-helix domain-containing protein [Chloroflexota bacterium]